MSANRVIFAGVILSFAAGCNSGPERARAIGEAFAGPASVALRSDLSPRSPVVATVTHGERLEVIGRRRRFLRVRTAAGAEGWVDGRQLMTTGQMAELKRVAQTAAQLPSFGKATVFDALNLHTEPNRQAPSFFRIPARGVVEVIGHQVAPRVAYKAPPILPPAEPVQPKRKPRKEESAGVGRPPKPQPPAAPPNWLEISRMIPQEPKPAVEAPKPDPPKLDDWSLVRTPEGKVGWALTGMLTMAIPDDVAQYAEGHRITSYLALGDALDPETGQTRHHWLWTTLSETRQQHQFDSFRVFIWNVRRRRYETAYIERNLTGYFPVEPTKPGRGFSLVVRNKEGALERRTYAFEGYRVRLLEKAPYTPPKPEERAAPVKPDTGPAPATSLLTKLKRIWNGAPKEP